MSDLGQNARAKQTEWTLGLRYKAIYSCGYLKKLSSTSDPFENQLILREMDAYI